MLSNTILLEIRTGIASLTFNRPEALNALSLEMMEALLARTKELKARTDEVRCIVLSGAGQHFMAGGDLKQFQNTLSSSTSGRGPRFRELVERYVNPSISILREHPAPVIARVQGACAGFGFSLMLGADLALAADNAYFSSSYASIGTTPDGGCTWFLPRIVGSRKAAELILLSNRIYAQEALDLGLINRLLPLACLDEAVNRLAEQIATGPAHAFSGTKHLLHHSLNQTLDAQLQAEADSFGHCAATNDFAEGVTAFVEKRHPVFKGN